MLMIPVVNEKLYDMPRVWALSFVYSGVILVFMGKIFSRTAAKIVDAENLKYENDHEKSLIVKDYVLACVNGYIGLSWTALVTKNFPNLCGVLITILIILTYGMMLKDYCISRRTIPKVFKAHKEQI